MDVGSGETTTTSPTPGDLAAEAVRRHFRDDPSQTTTMAARRFRVSEQAVLEALTVATDGPWRVVRLGPAPGAAGELLAALVGLGPLRLVARGRAAVVEVVGTLVEVVQDGPFLQARIDGSDLRVLPDELGAAFAVEPAGIGAPSFRFFDRSGAPALEVFPSADRSELPTEVLERFRELAARLAAPAAELEAAAPAPVTGPVPAAARPRAVAFEAPVSIDKFFDRPIVKRRPEGGPSRSVRRLRVAGLAGLGLAGAVVLFLLVRAFVAPLFWRHYESFPQLVDAPKRAESADGRPDGPLNIGLGGARDDLVRALLATGWRPADAPTYNAAAPLTGGNPELEKNLTFRLGAVSPRRLFGREQDLSFDRENPGGAGRRVLRLWDAGDLYRLTGHTFWIGTIAIERTVGTGPQAAPRTAPDLDATRDELIADLIEAGRLAEVFRVTGVGPTLAGQNAAGDPFFTDGELGVGLLTDAGDRQARPPIRRPSPVPVRIKDALWSELGPIISGD